MVEHVHRPPSRTFRDLIVWQKAHELTLAVYRLTTGFPKTETYALSQQMRRAAVSIPANIAEGFCRRSRVEKARFLNVAEGSMEETRYYLVLAQDLGYCASEQLLNKVEEVSRLLNAYRRALLNSRPSGY